MYAWGEGGQRFTRCRSHTEAVPCGDSAVAEAIERERQARAPQFRGKRLEEVIIFDKDMQYAEPTMKSDSSSDSGSSDSGSSSGASASASKASSNTLLPQKISKVPTHQPRTKLEEREAARVEQLMQFRNRLRRTQPELSTGGGQTAAHEQEDQRAPEPPIIEPVHRQPIFPDYDPGADEHEEPQSRKLMVRQEPQSHAEGAGAAQEPQSHRQKAEGAGRSRSRAARRRRSRSRGISRGRKMKRRRSKSPLRRCKRRPLKLVPRELAGLWRGASQGFLGLHEGLSQRPAIGGLDLAIDPPVARNPTQRLPESVRGNLMCATWALGRECQPEELGERLSVAGFDFIILVMSTVVTEADAIYHYLDELSKVDSLPHDQREEYEAVVNTDVLAEKSVRRLGHRNSKVFIALHKAKVRNAVFVECRRRSRGCEHGVRFGTLRLTMDVSRQKMPKASVGIIDVRSEVSEEDIDVMAAWAVVDRIDMLTGFFGNNNMRFFDFVADLAGRTKAISWTPMYQAIRRDDTTCWVHPSFFLFFGTFLLMTVPEDVLEIAETLRLGEDLWDDMLPINSVPEWEANGMGSPLLAYMGHIRMKYPDWEKWFDGCFQTVLWIGTATPSKRSQQKHSAWRECRKQHRAHPTGKGKGKGKGKSKGKDKGYWKGK